MRISPSAFLLTRLILGDVSLTSVDQRVLNTLDPIREVSWEHDEYHKPIARSITSEHHAAAVVMGMCGDIFPGALACGGPWLQTRFGVKLPVDAVRRDRLQRKFCILFGHDRLSR